MCIRVFLEYAHTGKKPRGDLCKTTSLSFISSANSFASSVSLVHCELFPMDASIYHGLNEEFEHNIVK